MRDLIEFFDPPVEIGWNVQPAQAFENLKGKGLRASFSYGELAASENAAAFTIAKMMDTDLLAQVKESLEDALATGKPYQQWADEIMPLLQAKGWIGRQRVVDPMTGQTIVAPLGTPGRLQTIFRTNLASAYSVGEWSKIVDQVEVAPFLMYDAVDDFRTRPEHAALDGMVRPVTWEGWRRGYLPPLGWNCRCGVIQLSQDDLDELGLEVSPPTKIETYSWTNPRTGRRENIPKGVDPGFDHNPGATRLEALQRLAREKAAALPADAARAALAGLTATQAAMDAQAAELAASAITEAQRGGMRLAFAGRAAERSARAQIDKALADGTPYLAAALRELSARDMTATERLATARERAARAEQSALLAAYRDAVLDGRAPSERAQAAFDVLPETARDAITAAIAARQASGAAALAAQRELDALLTGVDGSRARRLLRRIDREGLGPIEVLAVLRAMLAAR